jgi:hypothetical protein
MDRRTIIKQISILTGAAFVGGEVFIQSGCKPGKSDKTLFPLNTEQIALLDEIGETIIPNTKTPGAKAIGIGTFMHKMVQDCYNAEQQKTFLNGLETIKTAFQKKYSTSFDKGANTQREEFLNELNVSMMEYNKNKKDEDPGHYFSMIKQLTILGYFTSEAGATKALRYEAVPGKYDGAYPYKKGDKAWAT